MSETELCKRMDCANPIIHPESEQKLPNHRKGDLMDRVTTALLNEFSSEFELTDLPEDRRFEAMAAYISVKRNYSESFNPLDIVVGAGGDLGIDAVAIIVNGRMFTDLDSLVETLSATVDYVDATFIFVQADRGSFDSSKLGTFCYGVEQFFNAATKEPRNESIKELMRMMELIYEKGAKFKRGNPRCQMYYVTTGSWPLDGALPVRREKYTSDLMDTNAFRDVEILPIGVVDIAELYRLSKNSIKREFNFKGRQEVPEIPGVDEAFVGYIPASEFISLVQDESGEIIKSIFYDNVRDFQDFNNVNTEMRETLRSERKRRFVLMNNGITIITRDLKHTRDKFTIEDYQIVNGCQTAHVLFHTKEFLDESVMVPLRLIWTQDDEVINDIVHATNRQTEVSQDQFFALTDFARSLEDYFQTNEPVCKLYFERRSRQYDHLNIEKTRVINQTNVVRAFAAMFLDEPHSTIRSYKSLSDKIGKDIFAAGHKVVPYYAAASAFYRIDRLFANLTIDRAFKVARFQVILAVRLLLNSDNPPFFNSSKIETYCAPLLDVLWDKERSVDVFNKALELVMTASDDSLDRDKLHTLSFTGKLKALVAADTR